MGATCEKNCIGANTGVTFLPCKSGERERDCYPENSIVDASRLGMMSDASRLNYSKSGKGGRTRKFKVSVVQ